MKINPRNPPGQLLKLASLALLLAACASGAMRREEAPEEPPVLYGVAGNQLVRVDPADGAARRQLLESSADAAFYHNKVLSAVHFCYRALPTASAQAVAIRAGEKAPIEAIF